MTGIYSIISPPCGGKTAVCRALQELGITVVSTSDLIKEYRPDLLSVVASGGVVSDSDMIPLLERGIPDVQNCLIDSLRSLEQCLAVQRMFPRAKLNSVHLTVDEAEVWRRFWNSRKDGSRSGRPDDKSRVFASRLGVYEGFAPLLVSGLRNKLYPVIEVDGHGHPNNVVSRVCEAFGLKHSGQALVVPEVAFAVSV